ncbi:MAG: WS/DGAT domain-containing protein, partial [Candidatus Binatia bacterium]
VVELAARARIAARLYNLIVTNVPGPSAPLYLAGSRLVEVYPHLPLFEQQGIGIALLSYVGRLYVCIAADWSLGPLLGQLMDRLEAELASLAEAAGIADDASAPGPLRRPADERVAALPGAG